MPAAAPASAAIASAVAARARDLARHRVRLRPVDVGDHDASAPRGEAERGRAPDAGARAGDDRYLAVESHRALLVVARRRLT